MLNNKQLKYFKIKQLNCATSWCNKVTTNIVIGN